MAAIQKKNEAVASLATTTRTIVSLDDEKENQRSPAGTECVDQLEEFNEDDGSPSNGYAEDDDGYGEEGELELSGGTRSSNLPLGQHKVMKKRRSLGTLVVDSSEFKTTANRPHRRNSGSSRSRSSRGRSSESHDNDHDHDGDSDDDTQQTSSSRSLSRSARKRSSIYVMTAMRNDSPGRKTSRTSTADRPPAHPGRTTRRRSSMESKPVSKLEDFLRKDDFEKNMAPGNVNDHQISMPLRQVSRRQLTCLSDHSKDILAEQEHMESVQEVYASAEEDLSSSPASSSDMTVKVKHGSPPSTRVRKKCKASPNNAGFRKVVPSSPSWKHKNKTTGKRDEAKNTKRKSDSKERVLEQLEEAIDISKSEEFSEKETQTPSEEKEDHTNSSSQGSSMLGDTVERFLKLNDDDDGGDDGDDSLMKSAEFFDDSEPLSVTMRSMTDYSDDLTDSGDTKSPVITRSKKISVKKESSKTTTTIKSLGRLFGRGLFKRTKRGKGAGSEEEVTPVAIS
ncbi:unnamed protein product [Cylindrotheca closterium]|uniref:Uncharacterized protein n=1 Tax=Cylindrotheca closterium TaxID=2856 RepID=A0AAD2JNW0_9STRA|nr:unnamed protein product [Cylindrotheca closterium]